MSKIHTADIPYLLLIALSFYPIMNEAVASITAILFLTASIFFYRQNLLERYNKYGLKPLFVNCGFYLIILFTILYSEDFSISLQKIQSTLLLLFFPLVICYFFPKINRRILRFFSYGFIISNLILVFYFFNLLVEGLDIDRFHGLMEKSIIEQLKAINLYPYEFVVSKAEKHLDPFYETHKVYLSIHFLMALLLSFKLVLDRELHLLKKIVLGLISLIFIYAVFYSQAITSILAMCVIILLFPLFNIRGKIAKSFYILLVAAIFSIAYGIGFFDKYRNTNTESALKFIKGVFSESSVEVGTDKRTYIYDCSFDLISEKPIFGYGIGNVQNELNECYEANNYVVAEYKSINSEINSHNYYLNLWLIGGLPALVLFLYLLTHNSYYAWKQQDYTYLFYLFIIFISLQTENLLGRMLGVFLFSIFNALYYSNLLIDGKNGQ